MTHGQKGPYAQCCNGETAQVRKVHRRNVMLNKKGLLPVFMLHQVEYFIRVRVPQDCPDVLVAGCIFQMTFSKSACNPATHVNV